MSLTLRCALHGNDRCRALMFNARYRDAGIYLTSEWHVHEENRIAFERNRFVTGYQPETPDVNRSNVERIFARRKRFRSIAKSKNYRHSLMHLYITCNLVKKKKKIEKKKRKKLFKLWTIEPNRYRYPLCCRKKERHRAYKLWCKFLRNEIERKGKIKERKGEKKLKKIK